MGYGPEWSFTSPQICKGVEGGLRYIYHTINLTFVSQNNGVYQQH